jgi:hypothetical protein
VNRGLAILGDTLFMGTLDAHVLAIDARTGKIVWNTEVAKPSDTERYVITHVPLIVKDKVIVGTAGGDTGVRDFIAAFDVKTGKEAWRFYTIPAPGEPGSETWSGDSWQKGGGAIWNTGSYDPDLNLTYWGTGNPYPDSNGDVRLGDNLYTNSVVALDPDTGKLKWFYQFTPHDEMDYDSTQVPVLADIQMARPKRTESAAQGYAVGQSQRRLLRARPRQRPIPAGQALHHRELTQRLRRTRPAYARARQSPHAGRQHYHADGSRRHQLVSSVLQSFHWFVLSLGMGEHRKQSGQGRPRRSLRWPESHGASESVHQHEEGIGRHRRGARHRSAYR